MEPSPTFSRSYPPPDPDETEEQRAIREGWEAYREVWDKYDKDPTLTDWTEIQEVTTGGETEQTIQMITHLREQNLRAVGDTVFKEVLVGEPALAADGSLVATVTSCLDPSQQYLVDIDTGERSDSGLSETLREIVTMALREDGVWRASWYENELAPC